MFIKYNSILLVYSEKEKTNGEIIVLFSSLSRSYPSINIKEKKRELYV